MFSSKGFAKGFLLKEGQSHDSMRSETVASKFQYSPLSEGCIRLLKLEWNANRSSPHGTLTYYAKTNPPEYKALSYVWGNVHPQFPFSCNEQVLSIRQNLHEALRRIVKPGESVLI
jgi:Heterokaryon incompatibility protein (HET)